MGYPPHIDDDGDDDDVVMGASVVAVFVALRDGG